MQTGTHKDIFIDNELDCDEHIGLKLGSSQSADWLTKKMAVKLIKHLATVFSLSEILEAVEKYEEQNND